MSGAERQREYQRAYRRRLRDGARVLSIRVTTEHELGLIAAGLLDPLATDNRMAVKEAVERLLGLLSAEPR
jgi:hypothetical protein